MATAEQLRDLWNDAWSLYENGSRVRKILIWTVTVVFGPVPGIGIARSGGGSTLAVATTVAGCALASTASLLFVLWLERQKEKFILHATMSYVDEEQSLLGGPQRFIVFSPVKVTNRGSSPVTLIVEGFLQRPDDRGWKVKLDTPPLKPLRGFEKERPGVMLATPLKLEPGDSVSGYLAFRLKDHLVARFEGAKHVGQWLEVKSIRTGKTVTVKCSLASGSVLVSGK